MDEPLPLWQHLDELRKRLIYSLLAFSVALVACYNYSTFIVSFLKQPILKSLPEGQKNLYFTGIADKFMVYFKVSCLASFILISPFILYQVWKFVVPALYEGERKYLFLFVVMGTFFFLGGVLFGYYVVLPVSYNFLIHFGSSQDLPMITLTDYFSLTVKLLLGIGLIFELPVCLMLLASLGIVDAKTLSQHRRYAFLISIVVAAIITPTPDAFTMLVVMVPLYLLFEISLVGMRFVSKNSEPDS